MANLVQKRKAVRLLSKLGGLPDYRVIDGLLVEIDKVRSAVPELGDLKEIVPELAKEVTEHSEAIENLHEEVTRAKNLIKESLSDQSKETLDHHKEVLSKISGFEQSLDELRASHQRLASNLGTGGNVNRQIKVDGVDVLTRYTDINLIAGSGVTISTANDDTNRRVNVTITGSGGYQEPTSGLVDGSNKTYVYATAPNAICVDGTVINKIGDGITAGWTGTTTVTLTAAPSLYTFAIS